MSAEDTFRNEIMVQSDEYCALDNQSAEVPIDVDGSGNDINDGLTDVESNVMTLRDAGFGTDEDYYPAYSLEMAYEDSVSGGFDIE